jgi:hypothetical protein
MQYPVFPRHQHFGAANLPRKNVLNGVGMECAVNRKVMGAARCTSCDFLPAQEA